MGGSTFQSFQQNKQGLPLSHRPADSNVVKYYKNKNSAAKDEEQSGQLGGGIRRRLSSLSLKMQLRPSSSISSYPSPSSWGGAFRRRSKSVSSMGEYAGNSIRKWWDWGWAWILSRKPTFAKDLEINEADNKGGSWRHVFFKVKSELGKLVGSSHNVGLPQTFRYESSSYNYAKNFDHGKRIPLTTTRL